MLDEVSFATGMAVQPVLVSESDLDGLIARHLEGCERCSQLQAGNVATMA